MFLVYLSLTTLTLIQQDILSVGDPKALQYIFHSSGYRFPKTRDVNRTIKALTGEGLAAVEGTKLVASVLSSLCNRNFRRHPPTPAENSWASLYGVSTPAISNRFPGISYESATGEQTSITASYPNTLAYRQDK